MKTKAKYECEFCGCEYTNFADAESCEARGLEAPIVKVGDIVLAKGGYGWYDGKMNWVSNPEVRPHKEGQGETACHVQNPRCPKKSGNCFDKCCCFSFYHVVTAIDYVEGVNGNYDPPGHRARYHLATMAMKGKNTYASGYTFASNHHRPELVKKPPASVVRESKALLGKLAKYLL